MQLKNYNIDKNKDEEYEILKPKYKDNNMQNTRKLISKYKLIITILSIFCIFLVVFIIVFYLIQNSKNKKKDSLIKFYKKFSMLTNIKKKYLNKTKYSVKKINKNDNNDTKDNNEKKSSIYNNEIKEIYNISNNSLEENNNKTAVKRKIYIKYMDFWPAFKIEKFDVHKILLEKYEVIITDNPDYIIFGEFGIENRHYNCTKLYLSIENRDPNFSKTDYAIGIHYINNRGDRYFRKPTETHQLSAIYSIYNVTQTYGINIRNKNFVLLLYQIQVV